MSGAEIAGLVLTTIEIVSLALDAYKDARPGRKSSELLRKLNNEKVIYKQFLYKLLGPFIERPEIVKFLEAKSGEHPIAKDEDLRCKMVESLGAETMNLIIESLCQMDFLLKSLSSELNNMSNGTQVLEKVRTSIRIVKYTRPTSSVQRNLSKLTEINNELRCLVDGSDISSTQRGTLKQHLTRNRFLHRDIGEPAEVYKTMCSVYACDCDEPHIACIGCHCQSCHYPLAQQTTAAHHKWTFELVLVPMNGATTVDAGSPVSENAVDSDESLHVRAGRPIRRRSSVSVSLDEPPIDAGGGSRVPIHNLCSLLDDASRGKSRSLGIFGSAQRQYDLRLLDHIDEEGSDGHIITLAELIRIDNQGLSRRDRMQIAFKLCLQVLQLCSTPWMDDAWTWEASCALRLVEEKSSEDSDDELLGDPKREFPHLFIRKKFYSNSRPCRVLSRKLTEGSSFDIFASDPILARLGFALAVLAVNKPLAEIRKEKLYNSFESYRPAEVADFFTAKKLLKTGRIRNDAGAAYASVVRACIEGQYTDVQDAPKRLRRKDVQAFFDDAEEAIMGPLYSCCKDYP